MDFVLTMNFSVFSFFFSLLKPWSEPVDWLMMPFASSSRSSADSNSPASRADLMESSLPCVSAMRAVASVTSIPWAVSSSAIFLSFSSLSRLFSWATNSPRNFSVSSSSGSSSSSKTLPAALPYMFNALRAVFTASSYSPRSYSS